MSERKHTAVLLRRYPNGALSIERTCSARDSLAKAEEDEDELIENMPKNDFGYHFFDTVILSQRKDKTAAE